MDEEKCGCRDIEVGGSIANGKQYDIEITLPNDDRDVIYGIVKDCYCNVIQDAVVKLLEITYDQHEDEVRLPVSHTFTNKNGEFVFGPLCPDRTYALEVWVNQVKHCKLCKNCPHTGTCLQGVEICCP